MKTANTVKTLCLVGVTSLGLYAGASHADFDGHRGPNPTMHVPQMQHNMGFRQQMAQFDQRLDNQLQRILNGMETGRLTKKETIQLLREHQAINALERQYLADGRLGPNELSDLDRRLDQASRNILFENRDAERTGFYERQDGLRR
jgi:hypothetical protein